MMYQLVNVEGLEAYIAVAATPDDERNYVLEGGERGCSNFWWFDPAT